jgi:hypothetical protein
LRRNKAVSRKRRVEIAVQSEMICTVSGFDEGAVSYQHGRDSHFIAGGDSRRFIAFLLYEAITRQISRDAFWSVIVIVCALSLNLNYLWFSAAGRQQLPIENKPRVVVEEKRPWSIRRTMLERRTMPVKQTMPVRSPMSPTASLA